MKINLVVYTVFFGVLAIVVIALVVYRRSITSREDDLIHLDGTAPSGRAGSAHRVEVIDRWGKPLTVITLAYGLLLAAAYFYRICTAMEGAKVSQRKWGLKAFDPASG
jgi:hypothetical protein